MKTVGLISDGDDRETGAGWDCLKSRPRRAPNVRVCETVAAPCSSSELSLDRPLPARVGDGTRPDGLTVGTCPSAISTLWSISRFGKCCVRGKPERLSFVAFSVKRSSSGDQTVSLRPPCLGLLWEGRRTLTPRSTSRNSLSSRDLLGFAESWLEVVDRRAEFPATDEVSGTACAMMSSSEMLTRPLNADS